MGQAKKDIEAVVEDVKRAYVFTVASSSEELDLQDYMYYNQIYCDTTSYAGVVTLPNVSSAKGLQYTIAIAVGGTNAITIQDRNESFGWADITIEDVNDRFTCVSDGKAWIVLESEEAD